MSTTRYKTASCKPETKKKGQGNDYNIIFKSFDTAKHNLLYFFINYHKFITIVTFLYECRNLHSYQFDNWAPLCGLTTKFANS